MPRPSAKHARFVRFRALQARRDPGVPLALSVAMECHIHVVQDRERRTVHLEGGLTSAQVGELLRVCAGAKGSLRIDLTDLFSLDAAGFEALQRLIGGGAELVGVDQYLQHKMGPM